MKIDIRKRKISKNVWALLLAFPSLPVISRAPYSNQQNSPCGQAMAAYGSRQIAGPQVTIVKNLPNSTVADCSSCERHTHATQKQLLKSLDNMIAQALHASSLFDRKRGNAMSIVIPPCHCPTPAPQSAMSQQQLRTLASCSNGEQAIQSLQQANRATYTQLQERIEAINSRLSAAISPGR